MQTSVQRHCPPVGERGVIAILVALLTTIFCLFFLAGFAVIWLIGDRAKTETTVDMVAMGLGSQMIVNKNTDYTRIPLASGLDRDALLAANNQTDLALSNAIFDDGFKNANADSVANRDVWAPASVQITGTTTSTSPVAGVLQSFTHQDGTSTFSVTSRVQVNQVQLTSFTVSPARVMFLLDFSKSMRLYYVGYDDRNPEFAAINRVRIDVINTINALSQQFNFGVRIFSTQINTQGSVDPVRYTTNKLPNVSQLEHNNDTIVKNVSTIGTAKNDDGTDMANAIADAQSALLQNADPLAGAPILVIISDGEPNAGPGISCANGLQQCVQQAAANAQTKMNQAWGLSTDTLKTSPIESFTFLINRENKNNLGSDDAAFMQSISGDKAHKNNGDNFVTDHGNPAVLSDFLAHLPIKDYCMSQDIATLADGPNGKMPQNVALPNPNDWIQGYFTLGNQPGGDNPENDVYMLTQAMSFTDLFADLTAYPQVDAANPKSNAIPKKPVNLKDGLNGTGGLPPGLAKFYYDPGSRTVWLNSWACFNLTFKDVPDVLGKAHFRMRWGAPQLQYRDALPGF